MENIEFKNKLLMMDRGTVRNM